MSETSTEGAVALAGGTPRHSTARLQGTPFDDALLYDISAMPAVLEKLAEGRSLKFIASLPGMPRLHVLVFWKRHNIAGFADNCAAAEETHLQAVEDELLEIADDSRYDKFTDDRGNEKVDSEAIQRARLRVETRKWILSKKRPTEFGESQTLKHANGDGSNLELAPPVITITPVAVRAPPTTIDGVAEDASG